MQRMWTDKEMDIVREQYDSMPAEQIARILGRSVSSVYNMAKRYGIGRKNKKRELVKHFTMPNQKYFTPLYWCVKCETQKDPEDFYKTDKRTCKKCIGEKHKELNRLKKALVKPTRTPVIAQPKVQRVFQMVVYLMRGHYSVNELASKFDITKRTAYRYLILIESFDFDLEQDFENRYFIVDDGNCPLCGSEKHKSQGTKIGKDVHPLVHSQPGFLN